MSLRVCDRIFENSFILLSQVIILKYTLERNLWGSEMTCYVKAELGLNHTIIYTDDAARYFRHAGGTLAWRTHNPGNLVPGFVSARHHQIGTTGKFAIFPDYENGHEALLDCLKTTYKNSSIDDLVEIYAPKKDGNNVKVYKKFLHEQTGVLDDKTVSEFTEDEFIKLWRAIEKIEGYQEGSIVEVYQIVCAHKDKNGLCEFNLKTKGWCSKEECFQLAQNGQLDVLCCISNKGHQYIRARPHSSINPNLEQLVVKKRKDKK